MIGNKKISLISKIYANALVEIATQDNSYGEIRMQLSQVQDVVNLSTDLRLIMDNSSISYLNKIEIINDIFKNKISDKILNFLKILIEKNRFSELESIILAFDEIVDKRERKINVEIFSSIELEPEIKGKILSKLEQKFHSEVIPQWSIDENLIAGLMFKFGDSIIDTSIKSKLESLSKYMLR